MRSIVLRLATLSIILTFITASGCFGESTYPSFSYTINIDGLNSYYNDGQTEILVPVPELDNVQLFNDSDVQGKTGRWSVSLIDTGSGKMLSIRTNDHNLTNISIKYTGIVLEKKSFSDQPGIIKNSMIAPLYPVSNVGLSNYSINDTLQADMYYPISNYSSHIVIGNGLTPMIGHEGDIDVRLSYFILLGMVDSSGRGAYKVDVHELFPTGVNGSLPVNVWVYSSYHNVAENFTSK